MGVEIERKFLVHPDKLPSPEWSTSIEQGYVADAAATVRVRIEDERGFITLKGRPTGFSRPEFEYPVPLEDARAMLDVLCTSARIRKLRHRYQVGSRLWEVDVFADENEGLVVAEVELQSATEALELPDWVAREVSEDARFFNSSLIRHPFREWRDQLEKVLPEGD